jgi:hypothetical protein
LQKPLMTSPSKREAKIPKSKPFLIS